ncbi:MAG: hypothetical protein JSU92_13545 [Deltaproteobacteria bacterium]|nr:MAG: hypothetical protein JSU92_13545 [Deltaproteobacteria bacterium]
MPEPHSFLNKLLYTISFRKTKEDAISHLYHTIIYSEIGLDEGPSYYIMNIHRLLDDKDLFREAQNRSVVETKFSSEELREILEKLAQALSNHMDKASPEAAKEAPSILGISITLIPVLVLVLHFIWPQIYYLKIAANIAILLAGSSLLAVLQENIQGAQEFSLPFISMSLIVILGIFLFPRFGWYSTTIILGIYGVICVITGLLGRRRATSRENGRYPYFHGERKNMTLREYDVVRIVALSSPSRHVDGTEAVLRQPVVGDTGTIVNITGEDTDHPLYTVECVNSEGYTVWLADFDATEIELVN